MSPHRPGLFPPGAFSLLRQKAPPRYADAGDIIGEESIVNAIPGTNETIRLLTERGSVRSYEDRG